MTRRPTTSAVAVLVAAFGIATNSDPALIGGMAVAFVAASVEVGLWVIDRTIWRNQP